MYSGCIGSALCIDSENNASIVSMHTGRKNKWAGYETVLCAGPTLISNGKIAIALKHEGFRPSLLTPARRTAIGITENGKLLLVAINRNVSLYDTAKLMLGLKVVNALCLDGGSSTGLYYAGSFFAVPSRKLTNCIVVYSSKKDYDIAKTSLAPRELLAKADIKTETRFEQKSFSDSLNWLPQPLASNIQTNFFIREPAYSIRCLQMQRENLTLLH